MSLQVFGNRFLLQALCTFLILTSSATALENECYNYYSFQNSSDMPEKILYFYDGWILDEKNGSFESGDQSKSSFWIRKNGTLNISFKYKTNTKEFGLGVFQFLIDGIPQNLENQVEWKDVSISISRNGTHELKWVVYGGQRPFKVWIDSLSVKRSECLELMPTPTKSNQMPILNKIIIDKESPQENGTVINCTAQAYDAESDQLFYQFLLNGTTKINWSPLGSWNWHTTSDDIGINKIEVRIRDGKHAGPDEFDSNTSTNFTIRAIVRKTQINRSEVNLIEEETDKINEEGNITANQIVMSGDINDLPKNTSIEASSEPIRGENDPIPLGLVAKISMKAAETLVGDDAEKIDSGIKKNAGKEVSEKVEEGFLKPVGKEAMEKANKAVIKEVGEVTFEKVGTWGLVKKVGGKAVARLIPGVGWVLLINDFYNLGTWLLDWFDPKDNSAEY